MLVFEEIPEYLAISPPPIPFWPQEDDDHLIPRKDILFMPFTTNLASSLTLQ